MKISKFSCKLQALFFKQREKYHAEALARSFSGVEAVVYEPLAAPLSLQSCSTQRGLQDVKCSSHPPGTHTFSTVTSCFQFGGQHCPLPWVLSVCTSLTLNPDCKPQTSPWCSPLTDQKVENLHNLQACWYLRWKSDTMPGYIVSFPCGKFPLLISKSAICDVDNVLCQCPSCT